MFVIERLAGAAAIFVAAHFAMGFINPSAGGTGGALIFPFASNAGSRWVFGSLDGGPLVLLIPLILSGVFFVLLCVFVYRSFYGMRIETKIRSTAAEPPAPSIKVEETPAAADAE